MTPLPLLLLMATMTQDPRLGPSAVEETLRQALEDAVVQGSDEQDVASRLQQAVPASQEHRSAQELARSLRAAAALVRGEGPDAVPELPRDPALLRLLARRLPVSTPVSWLARLERERGLGAERDAALAEWTGKVPGVAGLEALRAWEAEGRDLRLAPPVHGVLLDTLRTRGDLTDLDALFQARDSAHPGVAWFANRAFWEVAGRWAREGEAGQVARRLQELAARRPPGTTLLLDGAGRLIREGREPALARTLLTLALEQTRGGRDSGALVGRGEACLGLAAVTFLEGGPWEEVRGWLDQARTPPRALLGDEREVLVLDLRASLLEHLLGRLMVDRPLADLDGFLLDVRREYDQNLLDQAWFGPFGPQLLRTELRRRGRSAELARTLEELVEAIERTTPQTGFGLRDRHPDQEERPLSWVFLSLAELQIEDLADPARASGFLEWRQVELQKMSRWGNLDLLVNTLQLLAQARLYLRAPGPARQALDGGLETAHALRQSFEDHLVRRIDRDEVPVPAGQYWLWRRGPAFQGLMVRGHLLRATVAAVLEEDPLAAATDVFQAGEHWQWSDARWTAVALDQARRGQRSLAARSASLVETWQDRFYDRACIASFLGQPDEAIRHLRTHLEEGCYTEAGRSQERAYMAADPDLSALHDHPEFPRQ